MFVDRRLQIFRTLFFVLCHNFADCHHFLNSIMLNDHWSVVSRVQSLIECKACLILALSLISSNVSVFHSWLSVWESVLHCELKMLQVEVHIRWDSSSIDWQNIWEIGKCRGASEKCCFLSKSQQPYLSHICFIFVYYLVQLVFIFDK